MSQNHPKPILVGKPCFFWSIFSAARGRQLERDTVSTAGKGRSTGRAKGKGRGAMTQQGVGAELGSSFHQIGKAMDALQGWGCTWSFWLNAHKHIKDYLILHIICHVMSCSVVSCHVVLSCYVLLSCIVCLALCCLVSCLLSLTVPRVSCVVSSHATQRNSMQCM